MPYKDNVGGGVSVSKDTATEADVRYPKTFHAGKGSKSKVGSIFDCVIKSIIPSAITQKIPKGTYIADDITIDGDPNLDSKNIRSNVSVFGVPGDPNVVDTLSGNLNSGVILKNYNGFSKGKEVGGNIETLDDSSFSPSGSNAYNDCKIIGSAQNSYVGAFDYAVLGYIAGKIRIHIANLLSGNIRDGTKVGGIGGYIQGTFTGDATATPADIVNGKTAGIKGMMTAGTMPVIGAVSVSLNPGGSYTPSKGFHSGAGRVAAKTMYVKMISAMAVRGFGASSGDYDPGPYKNSFTMPADGTVYYSGASASYSASGDAICEILKNGTVVDQRNINSSNNYNWRGTMHEKSFSAAEGDVITVKAAATSGSHTLATVDAVIVYFA